MEMSFAVREVEWLVNLLTKLHVPQDQAVAFFCDSSGTKSLSGCRIAQTTVESKTSPFSYGKW